MDLYGIGNALKAMFSLYCNEARGSGRTTELLRVVQKGDRVIFLTVMEKRQFEVLLDRNSLGSIKPGDVDLRVVKDLHEVHRLGRIPGRLWFDHGWLEYHYSHGLDEMGRHLRGLQSAMSETPTDLNDITPVRHYDTSRR